MDTTMKMETNPLNGPRPHPGYLLLFRGPDWDEKIPLDELQAAMDRYIAWSESLGERGKLRGGQALGRTGKVLSGANGRVVSDGPYPEAKEAVAGFLFLNVETEEEAMAIAQTFPGLCHGASIELRPALAECPSFVRVRQRLALAAA
jgi:hypothetical protein